MKDDVKAAPILSGLTRREGVQAGQSLGSRMNRIRHFSVFYSLLVHKARAPVPLEKRHISHMNGPDVNELFGQYLFV